MIKIDEVQSDLEDAILLALHMKGGHRKKKTTEKSKGPFKRLNSGMEIFCPKAPEHPREIYTFDMSDPDGRIYAGSMDSLVVDPVQAIGRGLEVGVICDGGTLKWTKFKPMPAPRGLAAITNQKVDWFSVHFRTIFGGKSQDYVCRPMAIAGGKAALLRPMGWKGFDPKADRDEMEEQLAIALSVYEDAHRSNGVLATVHEHCALRFPVGDDAYKQFFQMRDGYRNTPTGRKNPILHWCAKHMRSRGGKSFNVSGHDKGAVEMVVGNMRLSLQRGEGYSAMARL